MTFPTKISLVAALAAVCLIGAAVIDDIAPIQHRYSGEHRWNGTKPWFVDLEPKPDKVPHDWSRFFPYETGHYNMLHIPDKFEFNGREIEIVQGNEKDNFEIRKEIAVNPIPEKNFTGFLYDLHMHAADMVIREQYKTKKGLVKMTGYSVDTEYLNGTGFIGKITLCTGPIETNRPPAAENAEKPS